MVQAGFVKISAELLEYIVGHLSQETLRLSQLGNEQVEQDSQGLLSSQRLSITASAFLGFFLHVFFGCTKLELIEALHDIFDLLESLSQVSHVDPWNAHGQSERKDELLNSECPLGISLYGDFLLKDILRCCSFEQSYSQGRNLSLEEFQNALLLLGNRCSLF